MAQHICKKMEHFEGGDSFKLRVQTTIFFQNLPDMDMEPPEERSHGGYEGDMVITDEQKAIIDGDGGGGDDNDNPMAKRKGLKNLAHRWPKNIVPYKIGESAGKSTKIYTHGKKVSHHPIFSSI